MIRHLLKWDPKCRWIMLKFKFKKKYSFAIHAYICNCFVLFFNNYMLYKLCINLIDSHYLCVKYVKEKPKKKRHKQDRRQNEYLWFNQFQSGQVDFFYTTYCTFINIRWFPIFVDFVVELTHKIQCSLERNI